MRRTLVGLVVAVAALAVASGTACACSCVGVTDEEAFRQSSVVFIGTLREVRTPAGASWSNDPVRFIFDVESVYKGEVRAVQSIVTAADGASCGLEIAPGIRSLVFATRGSSYSLEPGEYDASLCGGTRPLVGSEQPVGFETASGPLPGRSPVGDSDSLPSVLARNWYWLLGGVVVVLGGWIGIRRRARAT